MPRIIYHFIGVLSTLLVISSCKSASDIDLEETISLEQEYIQEYISYTRIMDLSPQSPHPQGGDCWGDLFFQFVSDNSKVRIYDLSEGKLIQSVPISSDHRGFVSNCHCNTVCFGSEYFCEGDDFPLLYVSTGYASNGYTGALVYRITNEQGKFSFSLVQVLRFPQDTSSWTEFIPAADYAFLCYPSERIIFKVPMPKLNEGDIIIGRNMAIETYQFGPQPKWMSSSRNQDRLFYQGKIVFPSGVPNANEAIVFVVLDLEKRVRERIIDLAQMGLQSEPESTFIWRGDLCVAFLDQIVKLDL